MLDLLKSILSRKNPKPLSNKGGILVEFAIGAPILITVMLYGYDIFKLARIKERIEFCAHCAVNIIQNISQNREDKKITLRDIDYITSSALLPYFGGGTNQYVQSGYVVPSGFEPESLIYCVLGTGEDKAKILWIVYSDWHWPPGKKTLSLLTSANTNWSIVRGTKNVETAGSSIYKDLTIKAGEMKIILEIALFVGNSSSSNFYYPDGRNAKNVSLRERFGFMILEPKRSAPREIFNTVVIFTPKPGLFSSVPPS